MKRFLILAALALLAAATVSCTFKINGKKYINIKGEGQFLSKDYDLSGFDSIKVEGSYDVTFIQTSGEYGVSVSTYENIFPLIEVSVEGDKLVLSCVDGKPFRTDKLEVIVKAPMLIDVTVEGSADLIMNGFTSDKDLKLLVMGAGDFKLTGVTCKEISLEVNGAGDLDVKQLSCDSAKIQVNGAGDVDADFVRADEVKVGVAGAGDVKLSGTAGDVSCSISGVGSVDARSLTSTNFTSEKSGVGIIRK